MLDDLMVLTCRGWRSWRRHYLNVTQTWSTLKGYACEGGGEEAALPDTPAVRTTRPVPPYWNRTQTLSTLKDETKFTSIDVTTAAVLLACASQLSLFDDAREFLLFFAPFLLLLKPFLYSRLGGLASSRFIILHSP